MLAIWHVIVLIVNAALIGATTTEEVMADVDRVLLEQAMLLTVKWRYVYFLPVV